MINKGVWKKDPRGVEYVSFTMPESPTGDIAVFEFNYKGETYKATTNSTDRILGVIILMNPKANEKD